jgi:hypothetical protein
MALFATKAITSSGEPPSRRYLLKMLIVCLSFANLCFLNVWIEINSNGFESHRKYGETWPKLAALTLDILILAAVFWGAIYLVLLTGKSPWIRALKWGMIIALLLPLNIIRTDEAFSSIPASSIPDAVGWRIILLLGSTAALALLLVNWERISTRATTVLMILLAPSMPLAVGAAAWHIWQGPPHGLYPNKPLQPALPQAAGAPHLVWILFDMWDEALTFPERPAGLSLPELDRFQSLAFRAKRAYPPSLWTIVAVPSMLTGKTFIASSSQLTTEVMLTYDRGQPPVALTSQSTVFSEARRRKFNIGIVGWFIQYCRLFPECTECSWYSPMGLFGREEFEQPPSIFPMMALIATRQIKKIPLVYRLGLDLDLPVQKQLHAASYYQIHHDMLQTIANPCLNLVFVHMNVPHLPAIYDAARDAISNTSRATYAGNLLLVDHTLGDIRKTLEKAGMWDASTILLTADHPLRSDPRFAKNHRVPYLLKMPGETKGIVYETPMNTVVTKDLLLAILDREVTTQQQVAAWLDHNPPRRQ